MSSGSTESVIERLSGELEPVKPLAHPFIRCASCVGVSVLYIVASAYFLGIRGDLSLKLAEPTFIFENILMLFVSISAGLASAWMCVPDMRGQKWLAAVPLSFLGVFVMWMMVRLWAEGSGVHAFPWIHCVEEGLLMGLLPTALIVVLSMRGSTTRPRLMAFMNALAFGGLGYIALRFTCPNDTVGHVFIYHLLPFMVIGSALALLARRIFRW